MNKMLIPFLAIMIYCFTIIGAQQSLYKYRIYCQTEEQNVYLWSETKEKFPSTCPNDTSHTINPDSISIVDERKSDQVSIKEETVPTGGYFKAETLKINIEPGPDVVTEVTTSWPFDVSILEICFVSAHEHKGDITTVEVPSNKVFGILTQNILVGDTIIKVSKSVVDNVFKGFYIILNDGNNNDDLGRVIAIDKPNQTITVEKAAQHDYSTTNPTYILVTVKPVDNYEIGQPWLYQIGESKIGGSHVPANEVVHIKYTNKSDSAKAIVVSFEYLY